MGEFLPQIGFDSYDAVRRNVRRNTSVAKKKGFCMTSFNVFIRSRNDSWPLKAPLRSKDQESPLHAERATKIDAGL